MYLIFKSFKKIIYTHLNIMSKKELGQFYTTNYKYILSDIYIPKNVECIIEPFVGKGDLLKFIDNEGSYNIEIYDIDPKIEGTIEQDTLKIPPNYNNKFIITNPPFLARNKSGDKSVFELYKTNDLYKCFITSFVNQNNCIGGILIIPAGFFFSSRPLDVKCRSEFMKNFKIIKIKYFEETVFEDTPTTIVVFLFEKSDIILQEQNVEWTLMPLNTKKHFIMKSSNDWIIGGDIYNLPILENISVRRYVVGQELKDNEQQLYITLNALDSGTKSNRIGLSYKKDYLYPAKDCSRTYATLRIIGKTLSEDEQISICKEFNEFIEKKRQENWSLFLPQFRESKEYARKRIPFMLAYHIFLHIIYQRSSF